MGEALVVALGLLGALGVCAVLLVRVLEPKDNRPMLEKKVHDLGCGVTELLAIALYEQHPPPGVLRGETAPWDRLDTETKNAYRKRVTELLS